MKVKSIFTIALLALFISQGFSQNFNSLVGVRIGVKTAEFSSKIALDNTNYVEGTFGIVTPQTEFTAGFGAAFHRHIHLNEIQSLQFYYGVGVKGVIGDAKGFGVGPQVGLIFLYKKINIGVDVLPTYFFNDALKFRPLFGVHLRFVNK